MTTRAPFASSYQDSWAVVVGINEYANGGPLEYAVNDATKVAEVVTALGFSASNVVLLTEKAATRTKILSELHLLSDKVGADDRVLFFFAGHGLTKTGHRGEIGFLLPSDGSATDIQSLLRWDELTKSAELIPAKHVLFIMDACYGGLAVTRSSGGGKRFLKDIISRFVRQVLTAGKADQVVSDAGGPRQGHSVFTGHLLDALEGNAANEDGIITANGVMAYVYERVGRDTDSTQTPHYGCLDGDGDFVFLVPPKAELEDCDGHPQDILVQGPVEAKGIDTPTDESELSSCLKEFLSEPSKRIKLDELVMSEVATLLRALDSDHFPLGLTSLPPSEFAEMMQQYEDTSRRLVRCMALLGRWCSNDNRAVLQSCMARLADNIGLQSGSTVLLGLRWYPALLAMYAGGIGALAGSEYLNLRSLLTARVGDGRTGERFKPLVVAAVDGLLAAHRQDVFKMLPGHEKNYVPLSEHLLTVLQPVLEDTFSLGNSYVRLFDQFETLFALVYLDLDPSRNEEHWGPPGRFIYKYKESGGGGPFTEIVDDAKQAGEQWAPLRAGLFGGSAEQFKSVAKGFTEFMNTANWR